MHTFIAVCTPTLHLPLQTLQAVETHLLRATIEQSHYKTAVKKSKVAVHNQFTEDNVFFPPPVGTALVSGVGPWWVNYSLTLPSKYTTHTTLLSQAPSTSNSKHQGNVQYLVSAVKPFPAR